MEKALARYRGPAGQAQNPSRHQADVAAEVILASERIKRENRKAQQASGMGGWIPEGELWSAGLEIVWRVLRELLR